MDLLPLLFLFPILLIGIILVMRRLRSQIPDLPSAARPAPELSDREPRPAPGKPSGSHGDLETMRRAVEQMETSHIENLLDMGATLKPGAEEIFRRELARRRSPEDPAEPE